MVIKESSALIFNVGSVKKAPQLVAAGCFAHPKPHLSSHVLPAKERQPNHDAATTMLHNEDAVFIVMICVSLYCGWKI